MGSEGNAQIGGEGKAVEKQSKNFRRGNANIFGRIFIPPLLKVSPDDEVYYPEDESSSKSSMESKQPKKSVIGQCELQIREGVKIYLA